MTPTISPEKSRHLLARYEIWNDRFLYLAVAWREDSQIYTAHHICRMASFDSNPTALNELEGTVIQHDLVYAAWREDITEVTMPLPRNTFVKTPEYLSELSKPDLINAEINILELLSKTPHPNVCKYYGCIRDGAYVMGICLQKLEFTLAELVEGRDDKLPTLDEARIVSDVKAGLDFLHSLGLVHDDINPGNIMLDDGGCAVIIDFDSCVPLGSQSRGGTPGWSTFPKIAEIQNDEHGLDLVAKFIRGEYDGQDFEAFDM